MLWPFEIGLAEMPAEVVVSTDPLKTPYAGEDKLYPFGGQYRRAIVLNTMRRQTNVSPLDRDIHRLFTSSNLLVNTYYYVARSDSYLEDT